MGTHISRVKSVDLDAWTDEQLQSVLNWGNARANKWGDSSHQEELIADGELGTGKQSWRQGMFRPKRRLSIRGAEGNAHTERGLRKIENFIRTKYESKRWTMEGPIPDPATLDDDGDDDVVRYSPWTR
jgi:stromal membrane-associated protein